MKLLFNQRVVLFSTITFKSLILFTGILNAAANHLIKSNTVIKINSGTCIAETGMITIMNGGGLENQGTIIIKGNFVNENITMTNLGTGLFEFSGSTAQSISGLSEFGSLRIANTGAGVTLLSGSQKITNSFKLKVGLLRLEDNHLLLGAAATDSGGSSSSMVVATGSGELRKEFSTTPSFPMDFTYPVGDADGTTEYSPVTVHFTAGTFGQGNYLGLNLKNIRDPLLTTDNYLDRYWTFNNNGISGISSGITLNYLDADVHGTQADLYCLKTTPVFETYDKYVTGNQLTGTVTSFGRFTGSNVIDITPNITVEPNVMHGPTNYDVIVQVTELNFGNTSGLITVLIPQDNRWSFTYDPSATEINGKPVSNAVWTYTDDNPYHKFTTTSVINKNSYSKFGFIADWDAGQTQGTYTITSQINSWSGGENRIDNNVDAEKLDYFIY